MSEGTIVLVHGTGVRLKDYRRQFVHAQRVARAAGIAAAFVECAWGDPLGVAFAGRSLPGPPAPERQAAAERDFAHWGWLCADPLFELEQLTLRDPGVPRVIPPPGQRPAWEDLWERVRAYRPSDELRALLTRAGLDGCWEGAWARVVEGSPLPRAAFEASAHELPEAHRALARALIAQIHGEAEAAGLPGPSRDLREHLCERLLADWEQEVYGLGAYFTGLLCRAATRTLRAHRAAFSDAAALPVGDILLYQSRGAEVRDFIRRKIAGAAPPVTLVAHSLGGIACVDLLALPGPPPVARLITAGSQSPFLYELGALTALRPPEPLPPGFPPWLNLFDRNDFLSYVAGRLWPAVTDHEVESGQPFPGAHSAYFGNPEVWSAIRDFMPPSATP